MEDDLSVGSMFRVIKYLVWDLLVETLAYSLGWCFLRVLTLGRYPRESLIDGLRDDRDSNILAFIIGLVVLFSLGVYGFGLVL
jgi:hypothetical protein